MTAKCDEHQADQRVSTSSCDNLNKSKPFSWLLNLVLSTAVKLQAFSTVLQFLAAAVACDTVHSQPLTSYSRSEREALTVLALAALLCKHPGIEWRSLTPPAQGLTAMRQLPADGV